MQAREFSFVLFEKTGEVLVLQDDLDVGADIFSMNSKTICPHLHNIPYLRLRGDDLEQGGTFGKFRKYHKYWSLSRLGRKDCDNACSLHEHLVEFQTQKTDRIHSQTSLSEWISVSIWQTTNKTACIEALKIAISCGGTCKL